MANTYRIVRASGGWKARDVFGDPMLDDRTFETWDEVFGALTRLLRGEGLGSSVSQTKDGSWTVTTFPASSLSTEVRLTLPPPAAEALERVMAKTGDRAGEVFGKALGLYLLTLAAKERGEHVGSAKSSDQLETEFTGF